MADINLTSVAGSSVVKSVQRGVTTISSQSTSENEIVSAVDMDKSFLSVSFSAESNSLDSALPRVELTSTTIINFTREGISEDINVSWVLMEFY